VSLAGLQEMLRGRIDEGEALLAAIRAGEILRADLFQQEEGWALESGGETFSEWRSRLELAEKGIPAIRALGLLAQLGQQKRGHIERLLPAPTRNPGTR